MNIFPRTIILPFGEVPENSLGIGKIFWKHTPLAPGLYEIEHAIENLSYVHLSWSPAFFVAMAFSGRYQGEDDLPLFVGEITRVFRLLFLSWHTLTRKML